MSNYQHSELTKACEDGDFLQVQNLVSQGADIHAENEEALCCAAGSGHLQVVQYLVSLGVDLHAENERALLYASANGHFSVVQHLVSQGANPHVENEDVLRWAVNGGHLSVVQYLIEQGSSLEAGISAANPGSSVGQWLSALRRSQEEKCVLNQELSLVATQPIQKARL